MSDQPILPFSYTLHKLLSFIIFKTGLFVILFIPIHLPVVLPYFKCLYGLLVSSSCNPGFTSVYCDAPQIKLQEYVPWASLILTTCLLCPSFIISLHKYI